MISEIEFDFKDDAKGVYSEDPFYDLFQGGYIKPEELLSNPEQIDKLNQSIRIVEDFIEQAIDLNLIGEDVYIEEDE